MTNPNESLLPEGFERLQSFVEKWAVAPSSRRQRARLSSSMEELRGFYKVMLEDADAAIVYLNRFKLNQMPKDADNLMNLMLSLTEVAHSVELWNRVDQPDAFPFERVKLVLDK